MIQTLIAAVIMVLMQNPFSPQTDPIRPQAPDVASAIQQAITDGKMDVFSSEGLPGNAWGEICVGWIHEGSNGVTGLRQAYITSRGRYFYPASTIKLYAAIAAFEQLNAWQRAYPGVQVDEHTPLRFYPLFEGDSVREVDRTNTRHEGDFKGSPPITAVHEAHKLFVVSDNAAFNNLYDLVGPQELNQRMWAWGASSSLLTHRLSIARTSDENRRAPRVDLGLVPGSPQVGERRSTLEHPDVFDGVLQDRNSLILGQGFLMGGELVNEPFDFSGKNFSTLADLQFVLARLIRPDFTLGGCCGLFNYRYGPIGGRPFDLTDNQRAQLIRSATMLPRESESPEYDPEKYPDDYVKFLLPGLIKVRPLEEWRIVNKIGLAYGFVTENAYVEHLPSGNAVFVAAVIHRNPNGIYNDGIYDYETTLAEMATLGEVVGRALVGDDEPRP